MCWHADAAAWIPGTPTLLSTAAVLPGLPLLSALPHATAGGQSRRQLVWSIYMDRHWRRPCHDLHESHQLPPEPPGRPGTHDELGECCKLSMSLGPFTCAAVHRTLLAKSLQLTASEYAGLHSPPICCLILSGSPSMQKALADRES